MKTAIVEVISKYGNLVPDNDTREMLATDILNHFLERDLIDSESYDTNFSKKKTTKAKKKVDNSTGAPPRGVGPLPVEERPIITGTPAADDYIEIVTEEVVEEEVVETSPEETPKKEKKSKKTKSKKKYGWLGE